MRLIRSGALEPAVNLALDEALLESGTPTLRLYAWDPPGLSLGYFQNAAAHPPPPGFSLVRRPTGGGAIAHWGELTISWVDAPIPAAAAYARINSLVEGAARALGVEGVARGEGEPKAAAAGLCFDSHTRYDLLAGGRKFFGSAQRRTRRAFLLHGSLVLEENPLAAGAVSLGELCGREIPRREAELAVIEAAARFWGARLVAGRPTAGEWAAARVLVRDKYAASAWTWRR